MPRYERGTFERTYAQIIHDGAAMTGHKQPSDRIRVTIATTSRDAKMRKLIEALRKGPMRRPEIEDLFHASASCTRRYIRDLKESGIVIAVQIKRTRHFIYHLTPDATLVDAHLLTIAAPVKTPPGTDQRDARTAELRAKVLAHIAIRPSVSGALSKLFGAASSTVYKILMMAAEDGIVHRVITKRPKDGGKLVLWANGPGESSPETGRGFVASRKSVSKWEPMLTGDPLALPAEFFAPSSSYCATVAHEVDPRPVALTGFAALAQVRFELTQEARV